MAHAHKCPSRPTPYLWAQVGALNLSERNDQHTPLQRRLQHARADLLVLDDDLSASN